MNTSTTVGTQDVAHRATGHTISQRILVADDDEDVRRDLVGGLADDGHEVIGVADGTQLMECLDIIASESLRAPDLIAMDVVMPGRSGIEVLEGLRSQGCKTPVVLMTAFASVDLRHRVDLAGGAVLIQKPFDLALLRAAAVRARTKPESTIGDALARVRNEHERFRLALDEVARTAAARTDPDDLPASMKELTNALWKLFLILDDHVDAKERHLAPLLKQAGESGKALLERMHETHRQQCIALLAVVDECDGETESPAAVVSDAGWLVVSLHRDLDREEREIESLVGSSFGRAS